MSLVPCPPSVSAGWAARVHAEYRSAALVQQLGHEWLVAGASPDLIHDAHRVVQDELVHATDALAVLAAAGGAPEPMEEAALCLPWTGLTHRQVALVGGLELLALNESLAVPLFAAMRRRTTVPEAVAALDRVGRDEPRHAALGWTFVAWALEAWPDAHGFLRSWVPGAVERQQVAYASLAHDRWPDDDPRFAWGLLDGAGYAEVVAAHHDGVLRRRLSELELG